MYRIQDSARRLMPRQRAVAAFAVVVVCACAVTTASAGYHSTVVTVTAYNSVADQTSGHPKTGAWGDHLEPGSVAVSADLLARGLDNGTRVAIKGFKHDFVVRDKTASQTHHTLDIYMGKNVDKAREFGEKRLRIWWHTPDE